MTETLEKDCEQCRNIIMGDDSLFTNKTLLELEIGKINDPRLRDGLIFCISCLPDVPLEIENLAYLITDTNEDSIRKTIKFFNKEYHSWKKRVEPNPPTVEGLDVVKELVTEMHNNKKWHLEKDNIDKIKSIDIGAYEFFKGILLDGEHFEQIIEVEKIRKS